MPFACRSAIEHNLNPIRVSTRGTSAGGRTWLFPLRHNPVMLKDGGTWMFEHSVDCGVPVEFAWNFWTDVSSWGLDPDVESVEIDGPFAAGARGITSSKSSGRAEWRIVEAQPGFEAQHGRAVIEFPLLNATGRLRWSFEDIDGCTRMTQRFTLEGAAADSYASAIGPSLKDGIPAGMRKLCRAMENAAGLS
jgi:hypothetical protein